MGWVHDLVKQHDPHKGNMKHATAVRGYSVGRATTTGHVRDHNEDALLTFEIAQMGAQSAEPLGWFVLADGMGGHQSGEQASSVATRVVTHQLLNEILRSYLLNEQRDASQSPLSEALSNAVTAANQAVHEQVPGGGTTLTCVLVMGDRAYLAHAGDSRAYLFEGDRLRQITQDHSFVDRLVELGQISPSEALRHPQRNILYKAIGQSETLEVDTYVEMLPPSGNYRLLLCCDGVWGAIGDEQIAQVLRSAATSQEACDRLIEAANVAGGKDNMTAIVVEPQDYPG